MPYQVLLYYWFTELTDPAAFAAEHRELAEGLGLRGRVLIACEGINGTVSGTQEACDAYRAALLADPRFAGMEFKVDEVEGHVFQALHVRHRAEMITLGEPLAQSVSQLTGVHLSPEEWREMMKRDDVVILDGRNGYESDLGHFRGAICPPVESFREFPAWLEENRALFEGKHILSYCTGGIRCEKLSNWMLDHGFKNVYQLHGGVVMYGKNPQTSGEEWLGVNVVFDERVTVPVGERSEPLTACRACGTPSTNFVNCANVECNLRMILCPDCEAKCERCCSDACRTAPRLREKGKKWYESARRLASVSE